MILIDKLTIQSTSSLYKKAFQYLISSIFFFTAGGIKKSKKPVSALTIDANKAARLALATGVITKGQENSE